MWVEIFKMHLEWGCEVKDGGGWFGAKPQRERSMLQWRGRSGSRSIAVVGSSTGQRHPSRGEMCGRARPQQIEVQRLGQPIL